MMKEILLVTIVVTVLSWQTDAIFSDNQPKGTQGEGQPCGSAGKWCLSRGGGRGLVCHCGICSKFPRNLGRYCNVFAIFLHPTSATGVIVLTPCVCLFVSLALLAIQTGNQTLIFGMGVKWMNI